MRKLPGAFRNFVITIVVGGVAVGACLAALLPALATVGAANHYTSDKLGSLRDLKQRSTVYDAQSNIIAVLGEQNREDVALDGDEQLDLAGILLQTLRMPGHTAGPLAYAANGCLISGAFLFAAPLCPALASVRTAC